MSREIKKASPILAAKAAAGVGTTQDVSNYRHIVFRVSAALNSSLTYRFQGSVSDEAPDFSAAQSATNHWEYIETIDLQNEASVDGDTGYAINNDTVANNCRLFRPATPFLRYVSAEVSSYTDGNVTIDVVSCDND